MVPCRPGEDPGPFRSSFSGRHTGKCSGPDARCRSGPRPGARRIDRVRQTFEPVADGDADGFHAPVLDLGQHPEPELRSFPAITGPQPKDVPFTVCGDANGHVDGPVSDLPITDFDVDRVDEHRREDPVRGTVLPTVISETTFSVILEMVSLETFAPNPSAKCAAISPVVSPFALKDRTISSIPVSRRCRFFTVWGSNVDPVSLGTSISTGPISVSTVFERVPLRELPLPRPEISCFPYPRCSSISASKAVSKTFLVSLFNSPPGPTSSNPCSLA